MPKSAATMGQFLRDIKDAAPRMRFPSQRAQVFSASLFFRICMTERPEPEQQKPKNCVFWQHSAAAGSFDEKRFTSLSSSQLRKADRYRACLGHSQPEQSILAGTEIKVPRNNN